MDQFLPLVPSILFGLALQRGRVHEGSIVIGQMTFAHFVMLKMFLSALGASFLVSSYYFRTRLAGDEAKREAFFQRNSKRGFQSVLIGTALVGIGMALSGSCPGTVYAQIGSMAWAAIPIFLGAIAGAVAFEQLLAQPELRLPERLLEGGLLPIEQNALHKIINMKFKLNLIAEDFMMYAGAGLLGFTLLLELIVNWKNDLSQLYPATFQDLSILTAQPALVSGLMIGAAQYINLFHFGKQLGCSVTFVELSQLGFGFLKPHLSNLKNPQIDAICDGTCDSIKNPEQKPHPITAYGLVIGAFIGAVTSGSMYVGRNALDFPNHTFPVLLLRLFLGGFLAVFGARVAGGCTSGIGLSYTSVGSATGAAGMCVMFGSAILAGIILKIVGFGS